MPLDHPDFDASSFDIDLHLDYQVSRLWLDMQDMLPDVLEPVPAELGEALASGAWETWRSSVNAWLDALPDDDERGAWDMCYAAVAWASARTLDMGYLVAPPLIRFWRVGEVVTVSWDTREKRVQGALCWAETSGAFTMSVEQFQSEVEDFRARLDAAMQERLQEVAALGVLDDVALVSLEQQHRVTLCPEARAHEATDWDAVQAAIRHLEDWSGIPLI